MYTIPSKVRFEERHESEKKGTSQEKENHEPGKSRDASQEKKQGTSQRQKKGTSQEKLQHDESGKPKAQVRKSPQVRKMASESG